MTYLIVSGPLDAISQGINKLELYVYIILHQLEKILSEIK